MPHNPEREFEVFTEASRLSTTERAAFLDRACAGDEELRGKIEALLELNDRAGVFLEESPAVVIEGEWTKASSHGEKPGDWVGRYKLLDQIGEGGCGIVFMAAQEEPVQRRVALKVIKPGMDTKSVIARFEAERQALALMNHPNIAHVFDADATDSGRPYFVMEFVDGVKITDYSDRNSLPTAARLELFTQVCDAIQHAHQKGIIHRDIKPSNILVTTGPDGKPIPKVIDFGIAKATTDQPLTDSTLFTSAGMLIGTPAYMSPEQATLASAELDTRTDIYSLGVLLYELLTGKTPFDTRELLKAGFDEVRRVIREEEPARPSTRLSTMVGADLVSVSTHHGAQVPKLIREMRGDLDWIVMKALEKDRTRRYATTNAFAMDIGRYLSGEAVLARPPSAAYKLRKLVLRNRLLFGAISTVTAMLVVGFIAITVALSREKAARQEADKARQQAETDKTKSQQVTRFLQAMLEGAGPSAAMGKDTQVLKEILDKTQKRLSVELTNQPAVQADLRMMLGKVYGDMHQYPQAEAALREALTTRANLFGEESEATSDAMVELAHVLSLQSKEADAETEVNRALVVRRKLFGDKNTKVAECYLVSGGIFLGRKQVREAEVQLRKSLDVHRQLPGQDNSGLGDTLVGLGSAMFAQEKYGEAEEFYRQAMSVLEKIVTEDHPSAVLCLNNLAVVLSVEGKVAEAEPVLRRVVAMRRKFYGEQSAALANGLHGLTRVRLKLHRFDEAEDSGREAFAAARKVWGDTREETLEILRDLINAQLQQHKFEEAAGLFADALPPDRESKAEYSGLLFERCDTYARCSRWREAATDATVLLAQSPNDHQKYHNLAPLLVQLGDLAGYQKLCRTILEKFGGTKEVHIADRMAKDCLIVPSREVDLKAATALADIAVSGDPNQGSAPYFNFCKALAEFRLDHYEGAVTWARRAASGSFDHPKACAFAVMAMSQFKLAHLEEARTALTECNRIIEEKLPKPEQDLGRDWRDWIVARALQSEAKQMIEGAPSPTTPPPTPSR